MDILILGNGFDLAHELQTKYSDFLDYCDKNRLKNTVGSTNKYKTCFQNNLWLKYFLSERINIEGENWIDLENEIFEVIDNINYNNSSVINTKSYYPMYITIPKNSEKFSFYRIFNELTKTDKPVDFNIKKYYIESPNSEQISIYFRSKSGIINFLYEQLREFTHLFEQYLNDEIIAKITKSNKKYKLSLLQNNKPNINNPLFILNFNYTDTLTSLYGQDMNSRQKSAIRTFYVHGKINCNNIVLGTKFFDKNKDEIPVEFNIFRKHNQRHKYCTIEDYQSLLQIIKNPKDDTKRIFHIIGHSLEETDHVILRHLLRASNKTVINIYYHDENSQENLINNITEIIGEAEVMEKVRLIDQHNTERGILIPKEN